MKLIDAHAHLQFSQFDADREAVIKRAREAGMGVINVGTDLETSQDAVALAEKYPEMMWATVGIHPTDLPAESASLAEKAGLPGQTFIELEKLAQHPKIVGIGECGLDYFHVKDSEEKNKQKEIFERQIDLAQKVNKPLMIHCRDAYTDLFEVIKNHKVKANIHFFAGNWEEAKRFLDLGFTLSFTGVITFPPKAGQPRTGANQYDEVLKNIPLDRILIETDCPFVAPAPYRGKRNEPAYLSAVAERLAVIKGLAIDEIATATLLNTRRLFNLALS